MFPKSGDYDNGCHGYEMCPGVTYGVGLSNPDASAGFNVTACSSTWLDAYGETEYLVFGISTAGTLFQLSAGGFSQNIGQNYLYRYFNAATSTTTSPFSGFVPLMISNNALDSACFYNPATQTHLVVSDRL